MQRLRMNIFVVSKLSVLTMYDEQMEQLKGTTNLKHLSYDKKDIVINLRNIRLCIESLTHSD